MRRLLRAIAITVALVGSLAAADPAAAATYRYPGNQLSPQFRDGSCIYRIWYGNFGSTPFAKIRIYSLADCGVVRVGVVGQRGNAFPGVINGGPYVGAIQTDSCGTYLEKQATGTDNPAFAVGMNLWFPKTNHSYDFWHNAGDPVRPYRYC